MAAPLTPEMTDGIVENISLPLVVISSVLVGLATVTMASRCYVRLTFHNFGLDDSLMLFAWVSCVTNVAASISGTKYGTGRHYWDLTPESMTTAFKLWWVCYITYPTTMIAAKLSVGFFLLRITPRKLHVWILYSVMALSTLCGLMFFFIVIFQCQPVSFFWDQVAAPLTGKTGKCINIDIIVALTYVYSALAIITDFAFAILPMFIVWNLQMDRKTKIALIPIFGLACIASSAVAVRLPYIETLRDKDFLWATIDVAIWSETEQCLAVAAGCLATLRPIFRSVLAKLGFSVTSQSSGPSYDRPHNLKTFGGSSINRKGARNPFALSTFGTRLDDGSDNDATNESFSHRKQRPDAAEYRVAIKGNYWDRQSEVRRTESQEDFVTITKETRIRYGNPDSPV